MENSQDMIITLTDDEGNNGDYVMLDSLEYEDHTYCLFVPAEQAEAEEQEVYIMEYKEEKGEVIFDPVKNEILLDEIFDAYNELVGEDEAETEK